MNNETGLFMNHESYLLLATEQNTRFQFQSIGKRGIFEKVISFSPLSEIIFNLALLDYNPVTGEENDLSITDNGDLHQIMATVMKAILLFLDKHPEKVIYIKGNTESRTRLYQISINKVYPDLQHELFILGQQNENWHDFKVNESFDSFLIAKKNLT